VRHGPPLALLTTFVLVTASGADEARAQARPGNAAPAESDGAMGVDLPVREIELENGMRVLLLPRPGAPTISFVMQFGIGGVHEHLGTTGVAHLLEHMLFKGTETIGTTDVQAERAVFTRADSVHALMLEARAANDSVALRRLGQELGAIEDEARAYVVPNELDRIFTRAGAQGLNATTTSESTSYFVELPANRAELYFALEADRMANPVFREFYTERDVVTEERRMRVDASPGGTLYEKHLAAAFDVHPYGVPVVGWMSDLETLGRDDVAAYYRRFYRPNNAVLAVVGAFDAEEVEAWARRWFGPIPRGEDAPPVLAVEPPQRGERRVELVWDAEPQLRIGWRVPAATHPDAPALAVLTSILTGGRASRLHRRLVIQDRTAASVFATIGPGSLHPRLFQLDATPIHPATPAQLEEAIYEEVAGLAAAGPSAEEVERVRNQAAAAAVRRLQSNLGLAFQLADSESLFGDWRETFRATEHLRVVTAEDVRRVAAAYLTADRRTVATLVRGEGAR
jgi:predicted Zn-dependent peptidase